MKKVISEDLTGFDTSLAKKGTSTVGALIRGAGTVAQQFQDHRNAERKKAEDEAKAKVDKERKELEMENRRKEKARKDRQMRKDLRAEANQEKADEKQQENANRAKQIRDGFIFDENYKITYKNLLINLDPTEIVRRFEQGKVSVEVLKKMERFNGVLTKALKGVPGGVSTALRHQKFNKSAPMNFGEIKKNTTDVDKAKIESAYKFVNNVFSPQNKPKDFDLTAWRNAVKQIGHPDFDSSHVMSFKLDYLGSVSNFHQLLQHEDTQSMVYVLIMWFDEAFTNIASKGHDPFTWDGADGEPPEEMMIELQRSKFAGEFFNHIGQLYSLLRAVNLKLGNMIERCLHRQGDYSSTVEQSDTPSTTQPAEPPKPANSSNQPEGTT